MLLLGLGLDGTLVFDVDACMSGKNRRKTQRLHDKHEHLIINNIHLLGNMNVGLKM